MHLVLRPYSKIQRNPFFQVLTTSQDAPRLIRIFQTILDQKFFVRTEIIYSNFGALRQKSVKPRTSFFEKIEISQTLEEKI